MINIYFSNSPFSRILCQDITTHLMDHFSSEELIEYKQFRIPKRQEEWIASRIAGKRLINKVLKTEGLRHSDIMIKKERSGQPYVWIQGIGRIPGGFSLSHSNGYVLCGHTSSVESGFGLDLEMIESRSLEFVQDFFSNQEIKKYHGLSDQERNEYATLVWSAKESFLKAVGVGLSIDTKKIEIVDASRKSNNSVWSECLVVFNAQKGLFYRILWQRVGNFIWTVCVPASQPFQLIQVNLDE
jgi:4'-phosphopantetheinyl transferase